MKIKSLLIANRGEIAIRIARTASVMGIRTVTVYSSDDAASLHTRRCDEAFELPGHGAAAYLDREAIVAAALASGCDAVHPGYGFLSENSAFSSFCETSGLIFVGPSPKTLGMFGDKGRARDLARVCGLPVARGTDGPTSLDEARRFLDDLGDAGAIMLKALAGGGGRGMRPIFRPDELPEAFARCCSEATQAFGDGSLYVEQFFPRARHIEVQIVGDGSGDAVHLWDRECSLQRQRQKLIEFAPALGIDDDLRSALTDAALRIARAASYRGLGTIEFLVDASCAKTPVWVFMEANARLQVEHTVTEAVTGLDLVRLQLQIARGMSLAELKLEQANIPPPNGVAIQARVNLETMGEDGIAKPTGGTLTAYEPISGPGVRVDGYGYAGYRTSGRYDSLLAKVIVHATWGGVSAAARLARQSLAEFRIEGVETNIGFLRALLARPEIEAGQVHTRFVDEHATELAQASLDKGPPSQGAMWEGEGALQPSQFAGSSVSPAARAASPKPLGTFVVTAPLQGTIVAFHVELGAAVSVGQPLVVLEAMKMENVVAASQSGYVRGIAVAIGEAVADGAVLMFIEPAAIDTMDVVDDFDGDLDYVRPDLMEVRQRRALTLDAARPEAVAKRHGHGFRTARENIDDLCDPDSFVEYGSLVIAGRRLRTPIEELIRTTPADGMITGIGRVNGEMFGPEAARCVVMSYDYMVMAGTQGLKNHQKLDRMFELAEKWRLPIIFFAESGGGRPGDTDQVSGGGIFNIRGFHLQGKLSALVPQVGITNGRCFAGSAVLLGCCDVVIATECSTIGVGGPALIEYGGLGVYSAEEIGPVSVQAPNGVVDIVVKDEAEAVTIAKKYLSYFQGPVKGGTCEDQRRLRHVIPSNRRRVYDVREVIHLLADMDSVLELRARFGLAMVTALARIDGRPVGIIANNPIHLGGAIDSDAADKASRFMQLCDAFDIPLVVLADTPGNMVGPEAEKTALLRHCCRMAVTGPNLTVPVFTVVLRKGYGLGVLAMAGGSSHACFFAVSWPTGEFGGMGLEGYVKLGYRKELEAIADPVKRQAEFERRVAQAYEEGKALHVAMGFDFDEVIDPADTRRWIIAGLESAPKARRVGKKRPYIDTW